LGLILLIGGKSFQGDFWGVGNDSRRIWSRYSEPLQITRCVHNDDWFRDCLFLVNVIFQQTGEHNLVVTKRTEIVVVTQSLLLIR